MTIACRTQRGNCLLKQWSLETTPTKSTYQIQQTSQCHCEGTDGDSCSSWKSCPFMGANNFIQKWEKTSNRKEVEPCLQYISSLKLPQREALRNIGPINAPIWSNLSVLNSVIKLPFYVELSVAIISWSTGHLKLPQQKALTKYNRQVSAIQSQKSKSALLSILPHVPYIHTENWNCVTLLLLLPGAYR